MTTVRQERGLSHEVPTRHGSIVYCSPRYRYAVYIEILLKVSGKTISEAHLVINTNRIDVAQTARRQRTREFSRSIRPPKTFRVYIYDVQIGELIP